jgi:adenosylcobinamide kinase/adenosylcobinamide-phosphate guanylyltransferase
LDRTTLVIGGCRSGKSRFALELAEKVSESDRIFIATSIPRDEEMKERVRRHKRERGDCWASIEVPIRLPDAIVENGCCRSVILVDCITLWISNLLLETDDENIIHQYLQRLVESLGASHCPVILVSNEVGTGIVPENHIARKFRDLAGIVNQKLTARSDRVVWMVAGIPVTIKEAGTNRFLS